MGRKLTKIEYIEQFNKVHNNKYDYSLVTDNINTRLKVKIVCPDHGVFEQSAKNHKNGQGCSKCSNNFRITKEEFLLRANKKHNNKYEYLLENIISMKKEIKIIDKETGILYYQSIQNHLLNKNPKKMDTESIIKFLEEKHNNKYTYLITSKTIGRTSRINVIDNLTSDKFNYELGWFIDGILPKKLTLNYFKLKSSEAHNNKYDYSLIDSENFNNKSKVKIICPDHGIFEQTISNHLNLKDGCSKCVGKYRRTLDELKSELKIIHNNKYDYSLINIYKNVNDIVKIICPIHGVFEQRILKHLYSRNGCPSCYEPSKGEKRIEEYLIYNNINFDKQKSFDGCKFKNKLQFDFYLPEINTCIEYDGVQHFKPVDKFGGDKIFEIQKIKDEIKNKWCQENNVKLIRIKYFDFNKIESILNEVI